MISHYCVAGHCFSVEMPDNHFLWGLMSQYDPFAVDEAQNCLFRLRLDDCLPEEDGELIYDSSLEDEGQPRIDLYKVGDGIMVKMAPVLQAPQAGYMLMSEDYSCGRLVLQSSSSSALFALNNSLMLLYAFSTATSMTLEMHSSVVMNGGYGYMFLGKSGTGKSTHSRLWLENVEGTELMNDDNPIIRVCDDGIVRVYGSPWSGKTPCYRNVEAPIGGIVRISRASHNTLIRHGVIEAFASIYSSCSGFKADPEMYDGIQRTLEAVAMKVPSYTMECLPDADAALVCSMGVKAAAQK